MRKIYNPIHQKKRLGVSVKAEKPAEKPKVKKLKKRKKNKKPKKQEKPKSKKYKKKKKEATARGKEQ